VYINGSNTSPICSNRVSVAGKCMGTQTQWLITGTGKNRELSPLAQPPLLVSHVCPPLKPFLSSPCARTSPPTGTRSLRHPRVRNSLSNLRRIASLARATSLPMRKGLTMTPDTSLSTPSSHRRTFTVFLVCKIAQSWTSSHCAAPISHVRDCVTQSVFCRNKFRVALLTATLQQVPRLSRTCHACFQESKCGV